MSDPTAGAAIAQLKSATYAKLDTQLAALLVESAPIVTAHARVAGGGNLPSSELRAFLGSVSHYADAVVTGSNGQRYVVIDATASDGNGTTLLTSLNALGLQHGSSYGSVASGLLPISALGSLGGISNLKVAHESAMMVHAGEVTSQADTALLTDVARTTYGVDGSGLKIGVISDSFDTSHSVGIDGQPDTMATNIASGDLPKATKILQDYGDANNPGTDEGRAMAQLIHDVAPGAAIDFATANYGQANFANNILKLAADGAKVIVDDVMYYFEPAYQDGIIAQAVNTVAAKGVEYMSSAANNGAEGYESSWHAGSTDPNFGQFLQFAPNQEGLPFVASGYQDVFILQWDQPYASAGGAGSASDLDFYVTD